MDGFASDATRLRKRKAARLTGLKSAGFAKKTENTSRRSCAAWKGSNDHYKPNGSEGYKAQENRASAAPIQGEAGAAREQVFAALEG